MSKIKINVYLPVSFLVDLGDETVESFSDDLNPSTSHEEYFSV